MANMSCRKRLWEKWRRFSDRSYKLGIEVITPADARYYKESREYREAKQERRREKYRLQVAAYQAHLRTTTSGSVSTWTSRARNRAVGVFAASVRTTATPDSAAPAGS